MSIVRLPENTPNSARARALRLRPDAFATERWAERLGISHEAVALFRESEVIDLHVDSFLWPRVFPGYQIGWRHRPWLPSSAFFNHADLPRVRDTGLAGVCWDIVTNPWTPDRARRRATLRNIRRVTRTLSRYPNDFQVVRNHHEYREARQAGRTASFVTMQGGQGLQGSVDDLDAIPDDVVSRITLMHLTGSKLGAPSTGKHSADAPLTDFGRSFVQAMQHKQILVDLAHINRQGFDDALEIARNDTPVVVTHTGLQALRPIPRNLDDDQIRAIADTGGVVGILFAPIYLDDCVMSCALERVIDHLEHLLFVGGEDCAAIGSDFDGFITLPQGLRDVTELPRLVQLMLNRHWSERRVKKVLGENFLRVLRDVRP